MQEDPTPEPAEGQPTPEPAGQPTSVPSEEKPTFQPAAGVEPVTEPSMWVYYSATAALMGAVGMGTIIGYTAPALPNMEVDADSDPGEFGIDANDDDIKTWIASSMTLGALVGGLLAGLMASSLGRRMSMILYGLPFVVGWVLISAANSVSLVIAGRVVTGLCAGLVSGTAPTYVVEISTPKTRGKLGTGFQICVVLGIFYAAVFGAFSSWRVLAGLCLIPAILMSALMIIMPETPNWLASRNPAEDNVQAKAALKKLRSPKSDIDGEFTALIRSNNQKSSIFLTMADMKRPDIWKPGVLALSLMFFQQFCGINVVMFYQTSILKDGTGMSAHVGTIISCSAQVGATIGSIFLIDRIGRRFLLMVSGAGHTVSLIVLGIYYYYLDGDANFKDSYGWLPLVSLIAYIISFSIGWGPIPWMMIPEMTPTFARSFIGSCSTAFNWACAFIVTKNFKALEKGLKTYGAFWFFAVVTLISVAFVFFFLPETKNKTLEEIQMEFNSNAAKPNDTKVELKEVKSSGQGKPSTT